MRKARRFVTFDSNRLVTDYRTFARGDSQIDEYALVAAAQNALDRQLRIATIGVLFMFFVCASITIFLVVCASNAYNSPF